MVTGAVWVFSAGSFCAGLADHGASVAVVDLDGGSDARVRARADLQDATARNASASPADITDPRAVKAMAGDVSSANWARSHVLHNNAARPCGAKPERIFACRRRTFDLDTWREIMAVNLDGAFLVAREIGDRMAKRGRGSIIQTCSIYGVVGPRSAHL